MEYIFVDRQSQLGESLKDIESSHYLSIDTESDSLYHYYEKLCLLQIATEKFIYLIDVFKVDINYLTKVFDNKMIEKIFHSAESDIPLIKTVYRGEFTNIFDVMLAAKYSGIYKCGLSNLIEKYFSVSINKKYQKANWGMRPLKKEMLDYAATDVYYLKKLKDIFIVELRNKNLLDEFANHCLSLTYLLPKKNSFDPYGYLKINGSKKLAFINLQVLKALYLKREEIAKSFNLPSFKIISNETMLKIALQPHEAIKDLRAFKGMTNYVVTKHSSWILEAIKKGLESKDIQDDSKKMIKNNVVNNFEKYKKRFETLKKWRAEKAKKRNLFPELILTNDILWRIAHIENPSMEKLIKYGLNEYKVNIYGQELIALLSE